MTIYITPGPLNTSFFYPAETSESTEYFKDERQEARNIMTEVGIAEYFSMAEALGIVATLFDAH